MLKHAHPTTLHSTKLAPLPILSPESAVEIARGFLPGIAARAAQTETNRRVPTEVILDLIESGLFSMTKPKLFGGSGLGFTAMVEVAAILGEACGSTGWVYGVLTGHNGMVSLFAEQAQRDVFSDPRALIASVFRLSGKAVAEGGGYRLTGGEGRFCSGVDFADWVLVGNAVHRGDEKPDACFFLVPMSDVEIVDDWFTTGMRGTGSRTIKIKDAFIPAHRMVRVADIQRGTTPGAAFHGAPIYRLSTGMAQPFSLIGAPLGIAKGAIAHFAKSLGARLNAQPAEQIGEQSATFARLAEAAVDIDAAYTLILDDCRRLDASPDPAQMTVLERARIKRDMAQAAQQCRYAVTRLFESSGGSAIYEGSDLQRMWRDINASTAHIAFVWDTAATNYGRTLAGVTPSRFAII